MNKILARDIIEKEKANFSKEKQRELKWLAESYSGFLDENDVLKLNKQLKELKSGKPLAYILGNVPFLNCNIAVNENCLIPRPETEELVDILIKKWKTRVTPETHILDLCCGSGCIGIALQKALGCEVTCADISEICCEITKKNAKANGTKITVVQSDMFSNISQKFDLIVSNPPYVPTKIISSLDDSVKNFEPHLALDGKEDGLYFYRIIANQGFKFLKNGGELALEIGEFEPIEIMLKKYFKDITMQKDYFNLPRMIFATLK